jgi:hypothetical protein
MQLFQEAQRTNEINQKLYEEGGKEAMLNRETIKLRQSLVHKANTDTIQSIYDNRISAANLLIADHLESMENEIKTQDVKIQELHYQNTSTPVDLTDIL